MYVDLPNISPKASTALMVEEIRRYIYKANEQINIALSDTSIDRIWEKTSEALSSANKDDNTIDISQDQKRFKALRDLIVKSANEVLSHDDKFSKVLNGSYLAKSDFGTFLLNTKLEILETSKSISELFTYAAEANEYTVFNKAEIKRGLLDDSDPSNPIYGFQLGIKDYTFLKDEDDNYVLDEDGHRIIIEKKTCSKYLRITPDRISFLNNNKEVAYLSEDNIYFPKAHITGGSINLSNNFKVTSDGKIMVKKGTIDIGNNFSVDEYGNTDVGKDLRVRNVIFYGDGSATGGIGYTQSDYIGYNGKRNYGIQFGSSDFIRIGDLIWNNYAGSYKSGLAEGLYVQDDVNNVYKGRTASITIDGTTLSFRDGLLVGNAIPLLS